MAENYFMDKQKLENDALCCKIAKNLRLLHVCNDLFLIFLCFLQNLNKFHLCSYQKYAGRHHDK